MKTRLILHSKEGSLMPLQKEVLYTTEYIHSLPDGERAELIDGAIYSRADHTLYTACPQWNKQPVTHKLHSLG